MRMRWTWLAAAALAACLASEPVLAATFKCVDENGRVTFSNLECPVVRQAGPPTPTPASPPCELSADQRSTAERLERQFLVRFPDEDKHRDAELAGLQEIVSRMRLSQNRLSELVRERRTIDNELEFYKGRPLAPDLKNRLDASEAKFAAMADVFRGDENDIRAIVARFDCERKQFGMLWRGAAPGSSACAGGCS